MPTPAILLAFANDWVDDKRHLRNLLAESKAIIDALDPLVAAGLFLPPPIHNATVDDVLGIFRERRHRGRVRIFHFGGHASGATLLFEDQVGHPAEAHATGLAGYLGRQPGLVLVFLNGCCTEPQVRQLRQAGVKAVVATTRAIQDEVAAAFARAFYAELCARPLRDAFDTTVQAIRMRWGDDPQGVTRDVIANDERDPPGWPWILDCDPALDAWSLGWEVVRERRRTWRRRLLLIVAAALMASLASAELRRTTCRAPGLRSLCAAVGIGNVPALAEQAQWDKALGATGMNVEQEVRLCKSKSSGGPDGGNPSPTRQGRWVRLRLETATGTAETSPGSTGCRASLPWGTNELHSTEDSKVKQKSECPRGSVWWKSTGAVPNRMKVKRRKAWEPVGKLVNGSEAPIRRSGRVLATGLARSSTFLPSEISRLPPRRR